MTGYQLAKASGIARPNVYSIIERLEKRGAITRISIGDGVKYGALPPEEMLTRLSRDVDAHFTGARDALSSLAAGESPAYVWNLEGYGAVLARAENVVRGARDHLLVGCWSSESARLDDAIDNARGRGVEIATLCIQGCPAECGNCRGDIYRYPVAASAPSRWLMVAADDREALVGEIFGSGDARGAHTSLAVVAAVTAQYLRNTIAVAEIVRNVGKKLPQLLDREGVRAIEGAGLAANNESWFKQLLAAVTRRRQ
jgi:hypothetical protein